MKKLQVSIRDEHTLELQEDGHKGDLIDLTSLHDLDIDQSTIKSVVASIKKDVFDAEVDKVRKNYEEKTESAVKLAEANLRNATQTTLANKDAAITKLEAELAAAEDKKRLAVAEAVGVVQGKLAESQAIITSKDEQISYYKDLKSKLSTKLLGETLEKHCEIEFERLRATAFKSAYFEKDNDDSRGSKGDYIFRDHSDQGIEFLSIMFEMKNESDAVAAGKKNEHFLKELDKDRTEKGCEYAVLVSLLEPESELYNTGIVDVSHRYPKMYVIRPQFFIPMITLLRNAALASLNYRSELALIKGQNVDITTFENDIADWKSRWLDSMRHAGQQHSDAVKQIDQAIKNLEKVREALTKSDKHLLAAENKMDDLTVKRLTRGNPTMRDKFAALSKQ